MVVATKNMPVEMNNFDNFFASVCSNGRCRMGKWKRRITGLFQALQHRKRSSPEVAVGEDDEDPALLCPRCHFFEACQRYWTASGGLRNVSVGAGCCRHRLSPRVGGEVEYGEVDYAYFCA
ncbi:hypothetical protein HPP92_023127 [Vanilla planifolia]|uniref:Uncharacterized protein n=1 Tax=Vanilla planifolia TaxID=51239 RepID=A0A835UEG6_VANPL|nr:hypothetical protein HPP92_023127 [Vanilla planifolia]